MVKGEFSVEGGGSGVLVWVAGSIVLVTVGGRAVWVGGTTVAVGRTGVWVWVGAKTVNVVEACLVGVASTGILAMILHWAAKIGTTRQGIMYFISLSFLTNWLYLPGTCTSTNFARTGL